MHRHFTALLVPEAGSSLDAIPEDALLRALRNGKSTAWQTLLNEWSPRLYSYIFYTIYSEPVAQQVLESVVLLITRTIMRSSQTFDLTPLIVTALYRTVRCYERDWGIPTSLSTYTDGLDAQSRLICQTLLDLPPRARHVLLLRYTIGLTLRELKAVTGYSIPVLQGILQECSHQFEYLFDE